MRTLVFTLLLILSASVSHAAGMWLSMGAKDSNPSVALGFFGKQFGFEVGGIDNGDYNGRTVYDWDIPHNDYTDLGKMSNGQYGFDALYVKGLFHVGVGIYQSEIRHVVASNTTDMLYTRSKYFEYETAMSAGVMVPIVKEGGYEGTHIGIGYHTVRGANLMLAGRW